MTQETETKNWGKSKYFGLGFEYDQRTLLTERHREIQRNLIELCRTTLRPNAVISDDTYEYPRKNMAALASQGLLGLLVPKHLGGMGENHVCVAMVAETIARYGCPSTAMVYVMHSGAVACLCFRYHKNPHIQDVLSRIDKEVLIGTLVYSDPATGGHYWYPLSSKTHVCSDGDTQLLKFGSWSTSAGFADWYVVQTVSPEFGGNYADLSVYLMYLDELRANSDDWQSLGMHGNQSGALIMEGKLKPDRLVGVIGEGALSNDECVDPFFYFMSAAVWNGIALGCIDIARQHVLGKEHGDTGIRVADYPTIQDYFGECISEVNAARCQTFLMAHGMDKDTNNCDWSIHEDLSVCPRFGHLHEGWQAKFVAAKTVDYVSMKMVHACGGSGYNKDLGLERLLRDGKAGWVMGPSNEIMRQWVGNTALFGFEALDFWSQKLDKRKLYAELRRMNNDEKVNLAKQLMMEVQLSTSGEAAPTTPHQETEFHDPLNTKKAECVGSVKEGTVAHNPALSSEKFTPLKLHARRELADKIEEYRFALPNTIDHTGCLVGQYVIASVTVNGKKAERMLSPTSPPNSYGFIDIVTRFEKQGLLSRKFVNLKEGDTVEFKGPCGGFEYCPNKVKHVSLITAGVGVTPCIQIIRSVVNNADDKTKISLMFSAKNHTELLFKDELDKTAAASEKLKTYYTILDTDDYWDGDEGYFNTTRLAANMVPIEETSHKIIISGGPHMVLSVLQCLFTMGYPSERIYIFGAFGAEQIRTVYGRNAKLSGHTLD